MDQKLLFNCLAGCTEPDWEQYQYLEIVACTVKVSKGVEEVVAQGTAFARDADFLTVYARDLDGYAHAITDIQETDKIESILKELQRRSGLLLIVPGVEKSLEEFWRGGE